MNMHVPVLLQSWKQFGKMVNTMSFVGVQILIKQLMARWYSIIITVQHLFIILSWNLSALSNFKKKSNFREKKN